MENAFKLWKENRQLYLKFLDGYTLEQINKIPEGFSNNIIWNIGHIIVAQQGLVYRLSGLSANVSDEMVDTYKNGSKPTGETTQAEVDELRRLLIELMEKTIADYESGNFKTYQEYNTSTGFNLKSAEEAIAFNNYHEGLHLGFMMNIRKFI